MTNEPLALEAFELDESIKSCNLTIRAGFMNLARMLARMRDEKLYLVLDCGTFESYLGTLGPERDRSWIYKLLRAHDLFVTKLSVPEARILAIGPTKLDIIAPVVTEENKEEWLSKAETLSKSDAINEVRRAQGKSSLSPIKPCNPPPAGLASYPTYRDYCRAHPCCVCGSPQVDLAHYPRTKARGGKDNEVIPLCRECHESAHRKGVDTFLLDHKQKLFGWFYGIVKAAWGTND